VSVTKQNLSQGGIEKTVRSESEVDSGRSTLESRYDGSGVGFVYSASAVVCSGEESDVIEWTEGKPDRFRSENC
jgi:hypothetical protein